MGGAEGRVDAVAHMAVRMMSHGKSDDFAILVDAADADYAAAFDATHAAVTRLLGLSDGAVPVEPQL